MFSNTINLDLENQLEHVNKSIHESEKELKRLESEQSQTAASATINKEKVATSVVAPAPAPSFVNGFTLERLDNNDLRRLVSNQIKFLARLFQ